MEDKLDLHEFIKQNEQNELLRFSTAGSVDDGKSTLIGRLLMDSKSIYEDVIENVKGASNKTSGTDDLDLFLFTDGLKAEREQGITIDVAYRYFSTPKRKFIIADTPGHEQYTRNMVTGASTANLAIVLIDARNGLLPQSKRHAFIASLLNVPHVVLAVNKMDLVDYSEDVFKKIKKDFTDFAARLNLKELRFLPISALKGDNVVDRSKNMEWYKGESLLEILENIYIGSDKNLIDFRFSVQYVLRPEMDFRGYSGQIASGVVRKGDEIMVLPSRKTSTVKSIVTYEGELDIAYAPMSITVTLEDEIDISRGDMLVHTHNVPRSDRRCEAMMVWMDEEEMDINKPYFIKQCTQLTRCRIDAIRYEVDVNSLHRSETEALKLNQIGRVVLTANRQLFYDPYLKNRSTGSFILIDPITNNTAAAGMIIDRESTESRSIDTDPGKENVSGLFIHESIVSLEERIERMQQKPAVLWFTGLAGSGKSETAFSLERKIFDLGGFPYVLEGANMRLSISSDLDFTDHGRVEHLRRVAELAKILNRTGAIAICSFVSPTIESRNMAKSIAGEDNFIEIYINSPLQWCKSNDNSGVYEKAESGEIDNLPGVNAPYEVPENPDLILNVSEIGPENASDEILTILRKRGIFPI